MMKKFKTVLGLFLSACLIIPSNTNLFANEISEPSLLVSQQAIYSAKDIIISKGNPIEIDNVNFDKLKTLEEGTVIVKFKEATSANLATLFGISSSDEKGFHIYSDKGQNICYQYLNGTNDKTYSSGKSNLNIGEFNTIAFKADKTNGNIKLFANGELTAEVSLNPFVFIKDIPNLNVAHLGKFQRTPNSNKNEYPFDGVIEFIDIYNTPLTDDELIDITKETFIPPVVRDDVLFYNGDATGAEHFRIPALYTTKDDTVIAAIDARFGGGADSPNNLDTTVRRSFDGGKTWDAATLPNNFLDFPNSGGYKNESASFIDPVILEDETANNGKGRLFMLVDAFPGNGGIWGECEKGTGFTEDGKYLKLKQVGDSGFNYIAKPNDNNGYDICNLDETPTEYKLNGKFEVYQGENPLTVTQDTTNKQVPMNIFYNTSTFQILKTSYLYLTYSDDQGLTWSDPKLLDGMVKDANMNFLGVGPGSGIQLKNGSNKGRLIFPVYQFIHGTTNSSQLNALIYSDDHGETWKRSELVTLDGFGLMSESVPIELPDGSIMVFGRTNGGKVGQIVSTDGGKTWQGKAILSPIPAANCQLSAINYSSTIDGKPAIILASPSNPSKRVNGVINIGLIDEDGTYENGSKKYSIDWKYKTNININAISDAYAYSCITELPNGDIMVFYEGDNDRNIPFTTFTIDEIKGEKVEIFSDSNVIVTKTNNTNNAKKLSDEDFNKLKLLDQGTFIIKFKENSTSAVGTIFGIANNTNDTGFNIYSDGSRICYQFVDGKNTVNYKDARKNLNQNDFNTLAFKADKRNKNYKLFSNGKIVGTIPMDKYSFINNIEGLNTSHLGTFQRPEGKTPYLFDGLIESISILNMPLSDEELIEATKGTYKPPIDKDGILFHSSDATESEFFRIPALYTTSKGTVVAAIDARFSGTGDSPNNLDTAVRISKDNGATWTLATIPNHFDEFPDESGHNPGTSASFIDPVILEDETANNGNGRLFMLVDAFPSGAGLMNNNCPAGTGFDENGYLLLCWNGETEYTHHAEPNLNKNPDKNGTDSYIIYRANNTVTGHTLDSKFNLYDSNGNAMMMAQKDTGKQIQQNVFYNTSAFSVVKTSYLYLTHSDDQGLTWSDPLILNGMVKDADMQFLGTGPGSSIQLKNGTYAGRLLFPVYTYKVGAPNANGQLSSLIYSDDGGKTWHRGDFVKFDNTTSMMSESVPVEMPDGSIKLFGRTNTGKVGEATSTDGGKTWQNSVVLTDIPAANCQLSAINYSSTIDGKPAIILASPSNPSKRVNGVMRMGLISEDGTYEDGSKKYSIDWNQYKLDITGEDEAYAYSCLAELSNGNIMVFYEGSDLSNIPYKTYNISDFSGAKPEPEPNRDLREVIQKSKLILKDKSSTTPQIVKILNELSQAVKKFEEEKFN